MRSSYGTPCTWQKPLPSSNGRGIQSTRATSPISGRLGMSISMSMGGTTSTSRKPKGGKDYARCGKRESICLNPQNFAITIGKPGRTVIYLKYRRDTVGELGSDEMFASHMPSLKA